jgi:DNA-binding response OmpR family regulator
VARVLLVDDDPFVRRVVCAFLQRAGHEVIEAGDGEEGLERFDEARPDLVITDILMPRMNGLEMMVEMRRRGEAVPLIAMSGGGRQGQESVLLLARDLGARQVFAKPLDMLALLSAVVEADPSRG